jgi:threonine dehydratase
MFSLNRIEETAELVHRHVQPTAQHRWPLLAERTGCEVWVKHENHTQIGAFKVRGGIAYLSDLKRREQELSGVISATRGNHGQSIACAAGLVGLAATIVVPEGNSVEKNAAMTAQGAELVVYGHDFQAALEHARERAANDGLFMVESFDPRLILGVGSYTSSSSPRCPTWTRSTCRSAWARASAA